VSDDWKTLRVPADRYQEAKEQKESAGRTWGEQIVRPDDCDEMNTDELAAYLVDELGAAAGGPQVDDSDIAADVVRQFDYAELANRVADELETRRR
jgi:hypothetical protein